MFDVRKEERGGKEKGGQMVYAEGVLEGEGEPAKTLLLLAGYS